VEHMRQLFLYCDKDGNGTIDAEELGSVMHELGKELDKEELEALMNQLDSDGNGCVDFEEFLEGMSKWFLDPADLAIEKGDGGIPLEEEEYYAQAKAIFEAVDQDGSGMIDKDELKTALKEMGRDCTDQEVIDMMKRLHPKGDGEEIDFASFCRGFRDFLQSGGGGDEAEAEKKPKFSEEQVNQYREIFRLFDRDGSGTIDIQEMRSVLNELGKKVDNKELEKLMSDLDENGSGEVDFDEFLQGMERLDQLSAAPDVFQTDEGESRAARNDQLQHEVKELKKQLRVAQNVC